MDKGSQKVNTLWVAKPMNINLIEKRSNRYAEVAGASEKRNRKGDYLRLSAIIHNKTLKTDNFFTDKF